MNRKRRSEYGEVGCDLDGFIRMKCRLRKGEA